MSELLRTENVSEVFGGLKAVTDFNIHLDRGELVGLIGPNGAGKTTAFNMLTGVYQPTTGSITFEGESIVGLKPYQVTQRGIARTFQNIRLFSELTVLENVKIAFHYHVKYGLLESVFRIGRYFKEEEAIEQEAHRLLKIFHLDDKAYEVAKNLPYGAQRRLEIARALAAKPKLLLLDEHTAALDPKTATKVLDITDQVVNQSQLTTLMITHNMNDAIRHGNRLIMMDEGRIILDIQGEEKKKLTVDQLLKLFAQAGGENALSDRMLLHN